MADQEDQYGNGELEEVEGDQRELFHGDEDVLTEEEDGGEEELSPEQQMLENARDLLGLNEPDSGAPATQKPESFFSKLLLRPLGTIPMYPVKLVQVGRALHAHSMGYACLF